jgi:hypothetical protein
MFNYEAYDEMLDEQYAADIACFKRYFRRLRVQPSKLYARVVNVIEPTADYPF